jgi:predicted dehydrogenase
MGTIDLSWSLNKELPTYIEIYGTQGTIRVGWQGSAYRQAGHTEWVDFGSGYSKLGALRSQVENFAGAIAGEAQLVITAKDAVASVEVIEAAYTSMHDDLWIPVRNGNGIAIASETLQEVG